MTSTIQKNQREKEKKVFDAFSSFFGMGSIIQVEGEENSYPDGVLIQDGKEIAVEQTDYYYYKTGKGSSYYMKCRAQLSLIAKQLTDIGYKGCIGIKLNDEAYSISRNEFISNIRDIVLHVIDGGENHINNPLIDRIHFCPNGEGPLVIRDYACDSDSLRFCSKISIELILARVRDKEDKLRECKKTYFQHWLIISIPFTEHVNIDTSEYNSVKTLFDKVFIQKDDMEFEELRTEKSI